MLNRFISKRLASFKLRVSRDDSAMRLDRYVGKKFVTHQNRTHTLLSKGSILLNGEKAKHDSRVKEDDIVEILDEDLKPTAQFKRPRSKTTIDFINSLILYKNQDYIVLNKPAGYSVQGINTIILAGSNLDESIASMLHCIEGLEDSQPRLLHRIDKDTSGLLLLAANRLATLEYERLRENGEIVKEYLAIVCGTINESEGEITDPLYRYKNGSMGTTKRDDSKELDARSTFQVLKRFSVGNGHFTKVKVRLHTGRTHQIRLHMGLIGHPIVGEKRYERNHVKLPMQLHSWKLKMGKLDFTCDPPSTFGQF